MIYSASAKLQKSILNIFHLVCTLYFKSSTAILQLYASTGLKMAVAYILIMNNDTHLHTTNEYAVLLNQIYSHDFRCNVTDYNAKHARTKGALESIIMSYL